ncbi:hypothetical protein [Octadecabacter dasysiphoniae]|uniref:hypothetical protein n=1 Tax=Octadecabacter dasysiphoniae TaxID=2909341 RepID=UPI001F31163A|nr:hypothetical protein [Octadecabacter dasysiphoniae]
MAEPFSELEDLWQLSLEDLDTILQIACHPIYARYALQSILICPEGKTLRDQFAVLPVDDPEMLFLDGHDVIYTCAQTETKGWNSTVLFDEQIALLSAPMEIGPMPMDTPLLLYRPSHEKNLCFADWIEYSDNEYLFDRPVIHCDSYDLALHGALAGTGAMLGCLNFNARLIASGRLAADERCIVSTGRRHQIAIREGRPMTEPIVALARLLINNDT